MKFQNSISPIFLILLVLGPSTCRAQNDKKSVPDDFKVSAQFYPGYSTWKAWKTTITATGEVTQGVLNDKTVEFDAKRLRPLATQELADLIMKVKRNGFFRLRKRYDFPVEDNPTLVLMVSMDGQSREVAVFAPSEQMDNEEVKRFLTVWVDVLKKVPSPNPDQKPEDYEP
ncbi:MAG: hypothetical protein U0835_12145 [Isosphaeraceae bacterium]